MSIKRRSPAGCASTRTAVGKVLPWHQAGGCSYPARSSPTGRRIDGRAGKGPPNRSQRGFGLFRASGFGCVCPRRNPVLPCLAHARRPTFGSAPPNFPRLRGWARPGGLTSKGRLRPSPHPRGAEPGYAVGRQSAMRRRSGGPRAHRCQGDLSTYQQMLTRCRFVDTLVSTNWRLQ